jgi:excisionase family DNA binding protein
MPPRKPSARLLSAMKPPEDGGTLTVTILHAAFVTGLSERTIWRLLKSGELEATRIGGRTMVMTASLNALIQRGIAEAKRHRKQGGVR